MPALSKLETLTGTPRLSTRPPVGDATPHINRAKVDLPAPDGAAMATTSPWSTLKLTSDTAFSENML